MKREPTNGKEEPAVNAHIPYEHYEQPTLEFEPLPRRLRAAQRRRRRRMLSTCIAVLIVAAGLTALMLLAGRRTASPAPSAENTNLAGIVPDGAVLVRGVPFYSQLGEFPTGCESVSAAMLLGYYGFNIAPGDFIDNFLPLGAEPNEESPDQWIGCDPWEAFPGDPRSEDGWGCYSTVIERALNDYLAGTEYRAERLSGISLETICANYIDNGSPVLIWATIDMETPRTGITWTVPESGREITWIGPMHCLVLIGYDDTSYIFNDPTAGENVIYDRYAVETAYSALYEQAVILEQD